MFSENGLFVYVIVFLTRINFSFPKPATADGILTVNENVESIYRRNYASIMRSYMNRSVNPCNDFYEYACGNWKNAIEVRWTTNKRSNIIDMQYKLNKIVEDILKRSHINDVAPEYAAEFKLAQQFYNNCITAKLLPMRASSEYLGVLKEIGGFPAVDTEWESENFHWLNMSAHLSNYGVESLVKENIKSHYPFSPHFKMPKLGFDIELHPDTIENSSSKAHKENEKRMRDILTIYGVKNSQIDNTINEIFIFLKQILKLAQLFSDDDDTCEYLSNMVNKTEMKSKWSVYYDIAWLGKHLNDCCSNCYYWYKIIDLICENNQRAAANYLSLKFLFHMDARLQDSKYQKDFCISNVKLSIIYLFDHLYMKNITDNLNTNMIKGNNLFLLATIVVLTRINFCLSKLNKPNEILKATSNESDYSIDRRYYASQMLSFMNHSVNPCQDFYEYACGNWKWNGMEDRWTTTKRSYLMDIEYKLNDIIENILQRAHINDVAPEYATEFKLAKQFYNNCLVAELFPARSSSDYLEVLKEIGGFPAVDADWKSENYDWLKMSAHLSNYGINSFVKENIKSYYPFGPSFQMPDFGLGIILHNDTVHDNTSNAYQENENIMRNILTIYGVKGNQIDGIITEIFSLLKRILRITALLNEDDIAVLSKIINKTEIKNRWLVYNSIAWMSKDFSNVTQTSDDSGNPYFFFYKILDEILEKNKRATANYLSLKFLFHMDAPLLDRKYQKEFCISHVKSSMIYLFDHLYMKLYFNKELRNEVSYIIKEIRQSLRNKITEADWIDEKTRNAALLKESTMTVHIGRYEDTNLTKLLIEELKRLQFVNGSFEANYLNLRKFEQYMKRFNGLNFEKLSNTTKPLKVLVGMQSDAFCYDLDNSIYIMAGILMPPIYNKSWPFSLKYGTLGFLIAHEITHGFDTFGANFDEKGNRKNWWSTQSAKKLKERGKCYVNHYKNYFVPEIKRYINGKLTKSENIADSEGLRVALMTYRRYMKNVHKGLDVAAEIYKGEKMTGIVLSPEQLFFLGFAQQWCGAYTENDYLREIRVEHTIDKYRVIGTLSNNAAFAETFNCSLGSEMNPKSYKCELW